MSDDTPQTASRAVDSARGDDGVGVSRRKLLIGATAAGGAAWVAPSVLGFSQAFAAVSLPTVTAGGYVRAAGNAVLTVPVPSVTGTATYILVVATENVNPVSNITTAGGWTALGDNTASSAAPSFFIYYSTTAPGATTVTDANQNNDKFACQVFAVRGATAVALGTFTNATSTSLSVTGISGKPAATAYLLLGSSVASAGGWSTPSGFTAVSYGSQSNTPDIEAVSYNTLGTSVPTTSLTHTSAAATGVFVAFS